MKPIFLLCALVTSAPLALAQTYPNPRAVKDLPAAPAQGNQVGEFKSGPNTLLSIRDDAFSVASSGNDPIFYSGALPPMRGPYFIEFRMNSNAAQPLEIFWKTKDSGDFSGANKVSVGESGKTFDEKYRAYLIELPERATEPLTQIRFDPASGAGETLFEWIRIRSLTGKIFKEWKVKN